MRVAISSGESQRIFEEPQRHAQILTADIHRRVGVNKGVQRKVFIELIDIAAQIDAVFIPVEDHPADARVVLDKLQQVGAVLRPDGLEALRRCSAASSSLIGSSLW